MNPFKLKILCIFLLACVLSTHSQAVIAPQEFDTLEQEQQYQNLIEEFRCPKCQNQNLASSNAGIAEDLKHKTHEMVMAGKTDKEIRAFMIERYGDFVTYKPPVRPSTYVLWYFPPVLLLVLLGFWLFTTRKNLSKQKLVNEITKDSSYQEATYQRTLGDKASERNNSVSITPSQTLSVKSQLHVILFLGFVLSLTGVLYILTVTIGNRPTIFNQFYIQKSAQGGKSIEQIADELLTSEIDMPPTWIVESQTNSRILITEMQANVHRHPEDAGRWMRLGQLFLAMKDTDSALIAMERANRLEPNDEYIATTYAQTSYLAYGDVLTDKAEKALTNLLYTHDANNQKALMILIMSETRKGSYEQALAYVAQLKSNLMKKAKSTEGGLESREVKQALASLDSLQLSIENNQQQSTLNEDKTAKSNHP